MWQFCLVSRRMNVVDPDYQLYSRNLPRIIGDRTNPVEELREEEFISRYRLSKDIFLQVLNVILPDIRDTASPQVCYVPAILCNRFDSIDSRRLA